MTLIFDNGVLLFRDGVLAKHEDCCCDEGDVCDLAQVVEWGLYPTGWGKVPGQAEANWTGGTTVVTSGVVWPIGTWAEPDPAEWLSKSHLPVFEAAQTWTMSLTFTLPAGVVGTWKFCCTYLADNVCNYAKLNGTQLHSCKANCDPSLPPHEWACFTRDGSTAFWMDEPELVTGANTLEFELENCPLGGIPGASGGPMGFAAFFTCFAADTPEDEGHCGLF